LPQLHGSLSSTARFSFINCTVLLNQLHRAVEKSMAISSIDHLKHHSEQSDYPTKAKLLCRRSGEGGGRSIKQAIELERNKLNRS